MPPHSLQQNQVIFQENSKKIIAIHEPISKKKTPKIEYFSNPRRNRQRLNGFPRPKPPRTPTTILVPRPSLLPTPRKRTPRLHIQR